MRAFGWCLWAGLAFSASLGQPVLAQSPELPKSAVVTLVQERLFTETKFGRAMKSRFDADTAALQAENRKIDAELEAEERGLTDKRASMDGAQFRPLAEAFDKKANELRSAQQAKLGDLTKRREAEQLQFFQSILPILGDYMVQRGAVAIIDKSAVVLSLGSIDITDGVIAQIDEKLGDGSALPKVQPQPTAP
jgi:Skp family chaperone for outer membrane proteins